MIKISASILTDLADIVLSPETPLRQVLQRINNVRHHFQVVIDKDGRLLGTITDGDVRRALLHSFDLDAPASSCMNSKPITGKHNDDAGNHKKLQMIPAVIPFLPIADDKGKLIAIAINNARQESIKVALVMAGGEGRRLGAMTQTKPKPLLEVRGRPILDLVLSRLEDSGIEMIFISVHYLAQQIESYIASRQNRASIVLLRETEPLGTGGAVALLPDSIDGPLLVINGDVITEANFREMKVFNDRHGFDGCMAVTQYEVNVPFGVIDQSDDGAFVGIREKPLFMYLVSAGIYYLTPALRALAPRGRACSMPDIFQLGAQAGLRIGLFPIHEKWRDMGRPDDFAAERA